MFFRRFNKTPLGPLRKTLSRGKQLGGFRRTTMHVVSKMRARAYSPSQYLFLHFGLVSLPGMRDRSDLARIFRLSSPHAPKNNGDVYVFWVFSRNVGRLSSFFFQKRNRESHYLSPQTPFDPPKTYRSLVKLCVEKPFPQLGFCNITCQSIRVGKGHYTGGPSLILKKPSAPASRAAFFYSGIARGPVVSKGLVLTNASLMLLAKKARSRLVKRRKKGCPHYREFLDSLANRVVALCHQPPPLRQSRKPHVRMYKKQNPFGPPENPGVRPRPEGFCATDQKKCRQKTDGAKIIGVGPFSRVPRLLPEKKKLTMSCFDKRVPKKTH
ncbi:MAG: hypothetical protein Ct9H300mP25_00610 [Acidobacteriota bacterium]|nr:MAG: hypothetical protein Ct9H300mP25_00610 [Acidobacteriota bacterium]